jgi:type VI secretion system secreted protein Hcp
MTSAGEHSFVIKGSIRHAMAADMFLKIDDIKGESQDASHKDEIEVLTWAWGMAQGGTSHSGTGSGSGKVSVKNLSVTKRVDRASPTLMKACCGGKHFSLARLVVRKAGSAAKPIEYFKMELKDGLIASLDIHGVDGQDQLREVITLNFASFKCEYVIQTSAGAPGPSVPMQWNVAKNAES